MGKFTEWIKEHKKSVAVFAGVGVAGIIMYLIHRNSSSNSGSTAPATIAPPSFQGDTSGGGGGGAPGDNTGQMSDLQSQIQQLQTALDNSTQHLNDLEAQLTAMNQADAQTIAGLKQQYQAALDQVNSLQTQLSQAKAQAATYSIPPTPVGTLMSGGSITVTPAAVQAPAPADTNHVVTNMTSAISKANSNVTTNVVGYQPTNKWSNINGTYFVADKTGKVVATYTGQDALYKAIAQAKQIGGKSLEYALPGQ